MKLDANKYDAKDIFRILREWTGLTQEELGKTLGKSGRDWAKNSESGRTRFLFEDILRLANMFNITITFEKK